MNTVNAAGYLIGASIAAAVMRRVGQHGAIVHGSIACVLALALSAVTGDFVVLSSARLAAGIGGAIAFVAGGVATVRIAQRHAGHAAFLVSLYYIGPGLGILLSGLITPALLVRAGSWIVVGRLGCARRPDRHHVRRAGACAARDTGVKNRRDSNLASRFDPMLIIVVSYCLFSVGTIAYMTFMIAWLARAGAGRGDAGGLLVLAGAGRDLLAVPLVLGDCRAVEAVAPLRCSRR